MLIYFEVDIVSQVAAQIKTSFAFYHNLPHAARLEDQGCPFVSQFMFSLVNKHKYTYSVQIGQNPFEISFPLFLSSMHLNKEMNTSSTRGE